MRTTKEVNNLYHEHTSERVTKMIEEKVGKIDGLHMNMPCNVCGRKAVFQVCGGTRCFNCEGLL